MKKLLLLVFLFLPTMSLAIQCPEITKLYFSNGQWHVPSEWSVNTKVQKPGKVTHFQNSTWIARQPIWITGRRQLLGYISCNYLIDQGKTGYINLLHNKLHPFPRGENWWPHWQRKPVSGYVAMSCYGKSQVECAT